MNIDGNEITYHFLSWTIFNIHIQWKQFHNIINGTISPTSKSFIYPLCNYPFFQYDTNIKQQQNVYPESKDTISSCVCALAFNNNKKTDLFLWIFQEIFSRMLQATQTLSISCREVNNIPVGDIQLNWFFSNQVLIDVCTSVSNEPITIYNLHRMYHSAWQEHCQLSANFFFLFFLELSSTSLYTQEHLGQKLATDWTKIHMRNFYFQEIN